MSTLAAKSVPPLHAGFWRRAAAAVVDGLVLLVPNVLIVYVLGNTWGGFAAQLALNAAYFASMHSSAAQASLGKRALGIKVTSLGGGRIGLGRALARVPAMWLSGVLLAIGFLIAGFTRRKQALHDFMCGTLVVNREASPQHVAAGGDTMPLTGGVWAVIVLLLFLPFLAGIVAAITIPAYSDYTIRSKMVEVINHGTLLRHEVDEAYREKRAWPVGPQPVTSRFVKTAEIMPDGEVVVTVADELARGGRVRFTPSDSGGRLEWRCSATDVEPRYLPAACR